MFTILSKAANKSNKLADFRLKQSSQLYLQLIRFSVNIGKNLTLTRNYYSLSKQFKTCSTIHLFLNVFEPTDPARNGGPYKTSK